jgi:hypothetical protein
VNPPCWISKFYIPNSSFKPPPTNSKLKTENSTFTAIS